VLIPMVEYKGEIRILFEVRSTEVDRQPGDICFPGGRIEETDRNPGAAAIRETCEELGINAERIKLFGPLDYVTSQIGVIVYPFVGFIDDPVKIKPNRAEVGQIFSVPLQYLLDTPPISGRMETATKPVGDFPWDLMPKEYPRSWKPRATYEVYFYQYKTFVIWGLTARILYDFLAVIRQIEKK
jgi:NTP pyrophosphohydrolases including oxidative damage repair enzymes